MFITLVEDDHFYAAMLLELLRQNGFENVKHFDNGLECLVQVYEEKAPDVVIMDHQLGLVSGVEVLQKIRAYKPDLRVIFMSGQKDVKVAVQSIKQGAMDYIMKDERAFERLLKLLKQTEAELAQQQAGKQPVRNLLSRIRRFLSDSN
jgi:polysaccharide export outer membrane protein